jgi:predicted enzyme related to lactoylglutathione lyase
MSGEAAPTGRILWHDLTVDRADEVREFYERVVGWSSERVEMGDYDDFEMRAPGGDEAVAGVCHARGPNAGLPAQWLVYVGVEDLEESVERCVEMGGEIVSEPSGAGGGRCCVIRDPAGAAMALWEPA